MRGPSQRWRYATHAITAIWVLFAIRLMIADVWDETNGMLFFSSHATSLADKLQFVLTQSLGFWRPLPSLFVATLLHFVTDFDSSWRVLRAINIAMLVAAVKLLLDAAAVQGIERFATTIAMLFSGSAIIVAGWYSNIFDASALLLIAVAITLLFRQRPIAAGVILGIAFFCKETAILGLPFLVMLFAARRITFRAFLRCAIPATLLGITYFVLRSQIIPLGSANDVHPFVAEQLPMTIRYLIESFWRQTMKAPSIAGFIFLIASVAALRRPRLIAATLAFLAATVVIYWGMLDQYQNGTVIHYLNFVGRLYLVPATLMLFLLALERRTLIIAALCLPIVFGGYTTWRDHARFQRMYRRIYRVAARTADKPLTVHFAWKPLDDSVRGIRIGDIPNATLTVNPKSGRAEQSQ